MLTRRCGLCGRRFRYPGFSFDPDSPSYHDHHMWGHLPGIHQFPPTGRERDIFLGVWREMVRAGDQDGAKAMVDFASRVDRSLYETMRS